MNVSSANRIRVMFVDDDEAFLQMSGQAFADYSKGAWELFLASNTTKALQTLREKSIDLVVLDVQMAGVSGLQFSKLLAREYPGVPRVFLTSLTDDQTHSSALESGAALVLEKPGRLAEMGAIYATLNEFIRWRLRQGVQSVPTPFGLLDLVKMECKAGNSRLFEVSSPEASGEIFVKGGQIIHSHAAGRRGQSAFCHLVCLPGSDFRLRRYVEPPEQSIDRQWEFLVLEALHLLEELAEAQARAEAAKAAAEAGETSASQSQVEHPAATVPASRPAPGAVVQLPPPRPAGGLETTKSGTPASAAESANLRMAGAAPGRALPAPVVPRRASEQSIAKMPPGRKLQALVDSAGINVEEIVVGSAENALLYEWQCENCQDRLRLMSLAGRAAREVTDLVRGGLPDRIEFSASEGRLVVLTRPERSVLIRTNSRAVQPAVRASPTDLRATVWLSATMRFPGIVTLAAGRVDRILGTRHFGADGGNDRTEERLWKCFQDLARAVTQIWRSCWQLRVLLEKSQVYFIRRPDGGTLMAVLGRDPGGLDESRWESLVTEFEGLRME